VALIGVFAWVYAGRPGQGVEIASTADNREPAPGFALASLTDDGVVIDLGDLSGTPVVVNFWASWCVPCRREMPALEAVHKEYADQVAFIGVNHQDTRSAAKALVAESGVTYPSVYDPGGDVAIDYGLYGMPTTVFVAADGRVAGRHTGELTPEDLRDALDEVLAE
jgi:cytochrome c biogenesis protein CcmG/thiol:disulfide interchange protein DsbE